MRVILKKWIVFIVSWNEIPSETLEEIKAGFSEEQEACKQAFQFNLILSTETIEMLNRLPFVVFISCRISGLLDAVNPVVCG